VCDLENTSLVNEEEGHGPLGGAIAPRKKNRKNVKGTDSSLMSH